MSRQKDRPQEDRTAKRHDLVIRALSFEMEGIIDFQGGTMHGFAINYDTYRCTMIWKADFQGKRKVCFITAATAIDCIVTALQRARNNDLQWRKDKFVNGNS